MFNRVNPLMVIVNGGKCDVGFYVAADKSCQVREYLSGLDSRYRLRLQVLAEQLAQMGKIKNPMSFRHQQGDIWGFELADQHRVACFQHGLVWVCTHAFHKNDKWKSSDFATANRIRVDFLSRVDQG